MANFTKHRRESLALATDFSSALNEGDSVDAQGTVVLLVARKNGNAWVDVSPEFGSPAGTVVGDTVEFTLGAAGQADHQRASAEYELLITVETDAGETLVATPSLAVTRDADPDAAA